VRLGLVTLTNLENSQLDKLHAALQQQQTINGRSLCTDSHIRGLQLYGIFGINLPCARDLKVH
jgi:hypothetical protein